MRTNLQRKIYVPQISGFFDELNGVTTPNQVKSIEKSSGQKIRLLSLEETKRQAEVETEAIFANMPEDAMMNHEILEAISSSNAKQDRLDLTFNPQIVDLDTTGENMATQETTNDDSLIEPMVTIMQQDEEDLIACM